jgi:hypothetical protein
MEFLKNLNPRFIGIFILIIGIVGNAYNWNAFLNNGYYFVKASILFPFFACLGLSIIIYPMSREERLAKYGSDQIPWKDYPIGQKILIAVGLIIGILQFIFFNGWI